MRSILVFAVLALTGIRAQTAERIFINGKGASNQAVDAGSFTITTRLIQTSMLGHKFIPSKVAKSSPSYHTTHANASSIKPGTAPPGTTSPPAISPLPVQAPEARPDQEIRMTELALPEISSLTSNVRSIAAPSAMATKAAAIAVRTKATGIAAATNASTMTTVAATETRMVYNSTTIGPTTPASKSSFESTGNPSTTSDSPSSTLTVFPTVSCFGDISSSEAGSVSTSFSLSLETEEGATQNPATSETNTRSDLGGLAESDAFTPESDLEDLETSLSSQGEALKGAYLMGASEKDTPSSSARIPMPLIFDVGTILKKRTVVSTTDRFSSAAVFSGTGSAFHSAAVNDDANEETETLNVVITPAPEGTSEPEKTYDAVKESPYNSPESKVNSEILDTLISIGPGRPSDIPYPTEDVTKLIEAGSLDPVVSTDSGDHKTAVTDGSQTFFNKESTEKAASPEPADSVLLEASSEPQVSISSDVGSFPEVPSASKETPIPEPSVQIVDSTEAFPLVSLADSLSSSFEYHGNIGPVPIPSIEVEVGVEELEIFQSLEPTLSPLNMDEFLKSVENDITESDEPEMSRQREMSTEPEISDEPESSTEELLSSSEMEILEVDLVVKHPVSLNPSAIAEEIRLFSEQVTIPMQWTNEGIFLVSNVSDLASAVSMLHQGEEFDTFELNLSSTCYDLSGCESEMRTYNKSIRDGRMDEAFAVHDMAGVIVFLKGDLIDRSTPTGVDVGAPSRLNKGIIAGIAIGAVAAVSLLIYGVLFIARRGSSGNNHYDAEQGRIDSHHGEPAPPDQIQNPNEEEGSFMISNFWGSPRNTEALIPWISNSSSEGSAAHEQESSSSFITVDTAGTEEIRTNNLSNYRFDETACSGSDSDFEELDVDKVPVY